MEMVELHGGEVRYVCPHCGYIMYAKPDMKIECPACLASGKVWKTDSPAKEENNGY